MRRLVDVALESQEFAAVAADLQSVPPSAPEEVRGEIAYMNGRAQEAAGHPDAALAAYAGVTQRCRFWAQATYLSGLIDVEKGNAKDGENLLCKVADPKRSATTTPYFADERFFAVRDLARLGLGRIAHEQGRNDDARYYYYLVPRDSDRLAEALYEAATTRYEKKDYDGARELLDELAALGVHNRYEDEAWVLSAWIDLARCKFADADRQLVEFLKRYEPVRDAARRIGESDAVDPAPPGRGPLGDGRWRRGDRRNEPRGRPRDRRSGARRPRLRSRAAPASGARARGVGARRGVRSARRHAAHAGHERRGSSDRGARRRRGASRRSGRARQSRGSSTRSRISRPRTPRPDKIAPLRQQLAEPPGGAQERGRGGHPEPPRAARPPGADLPDLLRGDVAEAGDLQAKIATTRKDLADSESALAKDALHRLDLRLSRLLRRARLGRIESVLGRKRALEVEVEAIRLGYLPQDAVDSLEAARYLEDNEEYWPFEGDDWPDEYVGGETK